ncbi:M15 family metallopeptidase [Dactylosporangium aurantiacum]|uniref:M15 family metallopeptidase n=1 Tax=Dactylosporangium aurantiacum TaxID=35754 RepID=A0A9Q9IFJ7_9ACTN|nr:M15 family metallopeptidase [Dactylosporangium aurantiacum]MDG6102640.1 M15 family metallopeptidase [Dactylosporangium aurantiacum]UWZ53107.1 M15 family metallopeptidase [Dactylosporangium aurantiacum]
MAEIRHQLAAFRPPAPPAAGEAGAFAEALTAASGAAASGSAVSGSAAALRGRYANGRIPAAALAEVAGTGHRLAAPAAAAMEALLRTARADGVTIGITDSYRGYDEQVDLARRKGLYSQGGLAAKPGTSDHGWGLAVDLDLDAKAQAWMRANAGRFGFTENTPREPWHWKFTGA